MYSVADPGFPVGRGRAIGEDADPQREYFSAKTYVKMKELNPVGGGGGATGAPGSANDTVLCHSVRHNLAVHCSVTPFVIQQPIRRPRLLERVNKPMHTWHWHEETCRTQYLEILT